MLLRTRPHDSLRNNFMLQPSGSTESVIDSRILPELRRITAPQHQALESAFDGRDSLGSKPAYEKLLLRFFGIHSALEAQLDTVRELSAALPDFADRRKSSALAADLAAFGVSTDGAPICTDLPQLKTVPQGLGCLYVLEGSTLGGQFMAREVRERLNLGPQIGSEFFSSYGSRVGSMWKIFGQHLELFAFANPTCRDEILTAAQVTFDCFSRWLRQPIASVPPNTSKSSTSLQ
jgi:heme oxygenase (biliverdin-IX-beta and delta-forming)